MADVTDYNFKPPMDKIIKQEEYFINSYVDKWFESEIRVSSTQCMRRILYEKYK